MSERKLRLFTCGCCRRIWPLLSDRLTRPAVELAERYADGAARCPFGTRAAYFSRSTRANLSFTS